LIIKISNNRKEFIKALTDELLGLKEEKTKEFFDGLSKIYTLLVDKIWKSRDSYTAKYNMEEWKSVHKDTHPYSKRFPGGSGITYPKTEAEIGHSVPWGSDEEAFYVHKRKGNFLAGFKGTEISGKDKYEAELVNEDVKYAKWILPGTKKMWGRDFGMMAFMELNNGIEKILDGIVK